MQMNLDELKVFLKKFETNGEELFNARHVISSNLEFLLSEGPNCLITFKTALHLLEYQCQQFAFYEAISMDIIIRLFIHIETSLTKAAKTF